MKRDMDLIRKILMAVEADSRTAWTDLTADGYSEEQIGFHKFLMGQAGLVTTVETTGECNRYPSAEIVHMNWTGYEFLEAVRQQKVWEMAKKRVRDAGVGRAAGRLVVVPSAVRAPRARVRSASSSGSAIVVRTRASSAKPCTVSSFFSSRARMAAA